MTMSSSFQRGFASPAPELKPPLIWLYRPAPFHCFIGWMSHGRHILMLMRLLWNGGERIIPNCTLNSLSTCRRSAGCRPAICSHQAVVRGSTGS